MIYSLKFLISRQLIRPVVICWVVALLVWAPTLPALVICVPVLITA
jgi:hypothetical protein